MLSPIYSTASIAPLHLQTTSWFHYHYQWNILYYCMSIVIWMVSDLPPTVVNITILFYSVYILSWLNLSVWINILNAVIPLGKIVASPSPHNGKKKKKKRQRKEKRKNNGLVLQVLPRYSVVSCPCHLKR